MEVLSYGIGDGNGITTFIQTEIGFKILRGIGKGIADGCGSGTGSGAGWGSGCVRSMCSGSGED